MPKIEITLIAVEVRKWDLETQKINLLSYYMLENEEKSILFDVSILQPPEMVEEFLGKWRYECAQNLRAQLNDEELEVEFDNETFLRQKVYNYFKRITSELNNTRRKKGQPKMIFTTHMDVYNETQDISFLANRIQFFVVLNWARKYYERDDYKKAIEPLRKLIKVNPNYGMGYKWLARSLKKIRKYDEAMRYYEKYAEVDNSIDAWLDLAKSYRKGKLFEKSEQIYHDVLAKQPDNREARIGLAQIRYANKEDEYLTILDELYKEEPDWVKDWLVEEFNFRIYMPEKILLSPVQAAKFLGFKQIFELTQKAFKNEIPSHFNPSKARLSFYREELEKWAMVMNRYQCLPEEIKLYPEKIDQFGESEDPEVNEKAPADAAAGNSEEGKHSRTKVEEILMHIRARKAQKAIEKAEQEEGGQSAGKAPEESTQRQKRSPQKEAQTAREKTPSRTSKAHRNGPKATRDQKDQDKEKEDEAEQNKLTEEKPKGRKTKKKKTETSTS